MQRNLQIRVGLKNFQERKIAILVSRLENTVEVADGLMVVQDKAELDLGISHSLISLAALFAASRGLVAVALENRIPIVPHRLIFGIYQLQFYRFCRILIDRIDDFRTIAVTKADNLTLFNGKA
jgi:hypothetical protein